jgi:DNA polymerase II
MCDELTGWLLDLYADTDEGVVIWLLAEAGERLRFRLPFFTSFYAAGSFDRLRQLWLFLKAHPIPTELARVQRDDLFDGILDVMRIVVDTAVQPQLFHHIQRAFPELTYYDADIPVSVQVAAQLDLFPAAYCQVQVKGDKIVAARPLLSRWVIDTPLPPLHVMYIEPNCDPSHRNPSHLWVTINGMRRRYGLANGRLLLIGLNATLRRHDPDLILTKFGDGWLFPLLRGLASKHGLPFNPSRDEKRPFLHKQANSYFTYGMVLHRSEQTYLYGRWHIDIKNSLLFHEYDVNGVIEQARVTGMPVQEMARRSPGAGITAMQMITAMRRGVMVPHKKQQAEYPKSARALMRADRGGMVFQPQIGLHIDVIEIDFVSMYPSIISLFNISPETVKVNSQQVEIVPELGMFIDQSRRGLLPETLQPILEKRIAIKARLTHMTQQDCRYNALKSRATALKWLLVVAFGYAGYKRARFGRIEAHEAITAYSREALLRAKEIAEGLGYVVIHMYVDGLWVKKMGVQTETAVQPLLDEIEQHTGLPIALEGVYKWIAFLSSKTDARVPVPNRYFGVFKNGEIKMRGIAARRHDTPPFIARLQEDVLQQMRDSVDVERDLPAIIELVREQLAQLTAGKIPLQQLLVSQRLSRTVREYKVLSAAARAVAQLETAGKLRYPGQRVQFLLVRGEARVWAWDLPGKPGVTSLDTAAYIELVFRALETILEPWGVKRPLLDEWVLHDWVQGHFFLNRRGDVKAQKREGVPLC